MSRSGLATGRFYARPSGPADSAARRMTAPASLRRPSCVDLYRRDAAVMPRGTQWFDVHTHTGTERPRRDQQPRRRRSSPALDVAGHAQALVFTMHEPDGYPAANDRVIAEAAGSGGRLHALCAPRPARRPARRGGTLPGRGRGRAEAPSSGRALRAARQRHRADRRAGGRAPAADHHPRGARDPRARPRHGRVGHALPGGSTHPGPRRDQRPGLDLARGRAPAQPLLRHRVVARGRPARALRARPARPHPVRQRHALRAPASSTAWRSSDVASRSASPPTCSPRSPAATWRT